MKGCSWCDGVFALMKTHGAMRVEDGGFVLESWGIMGVSMIGERDICLDHLMHAACLHHRRQRFE
jgi:hypothetical protein